MPALDASEFQQFADGFAAARSKRSRKYIRAPARQGQLFGRLFPHEALAIRDEPPDHPGQACHRDIAQEEGRTDASRKLECWRDECWRVGILFNPSLHFSITPSL